MSIIPGELVSIGGNIDGIMPEEIEKLPYMDIQQLGVDPHYDGPTMFQVYGYLEGQSDIFPYVLPKSELLIKPGDRTTREFETSMDGRKFWHVTYPEEGFNNPVRQAITNFVRKYPYPHSAPTDEGLLPEFYKDLDTYQHFVREEMKRHLYNAYNANRDGSLPGAVDLALAFNGGRIVGSSAEEIGFSRGNMTTMQIKRVPMQDGRLLIGIGGVKFSEAIMRRERIFSMVADDCSATYGTYRAIQSIYEKMGVIVESRAIVGVIGTQHPILDDFFSTEMPTGVFLSVVCRKLGNNAYLYEPDDQLLPGETMAQTAGDMGKILSQRVPDSRIPDHTIWGKDLPAHIEYN